MRKSNSIRKKRLHKPYRLRDEVIQWKSIPLCESYFAKIHRVARLTSADSICSNLTEK